MTPSITESTLSSSSAELQLPATPPAPPPTPTQKLHPIALTMPITNLDEFTGEPDGNVQGPTFLVQFLRVIDKLQVKGDSEMIWRIGRYLTPDSEAKEWYAEMGSMITSWSIFATEFRVRFLGIQKAKKTSAELKREMIGLELKVDDLDKTDMYKEWNKNCCEKGGSPLLQVLKLHWLL